MTVDDDVIRKLNIAIYMLGRVIDELQVRFIEQVWDHLPTKKRMDVMLIRAEHFRRESRIENSSPEEKQTLLKNSEKLISKLEDVESCLRSGESIATILDLLDHLCPLWPFC